MAVFGPQDRCDHHCDHDDRHHFKRVHLNLLSTCRSAAVAQGFDLRRGLNSAVGDDLLEHAHARFELGVAGGILRRLLGGQAGFDLKLAFP